TGVQTCALPILIGKRHMQYSLHLQNGDSYGQDTLLLLYVIIQLWSTPLIQSQSVDKLSILFNSFSSPLLSTTSRFLPCGSLQKITGLLMLFPASNLRRLIIYFHSSATSTTHFIYAERLGSQCQNYRNSCAPSLAWT